MSNNKKTIFFAIEVSQELSKTQEKNIILENCDISVSKKGNQNNNYNIINIKVVPDDSAVLSMTFDELENLLDEQTNDMKEALLKKYPQAIELTAQEVEEISDDVENKREERLTINLNEEEKIARAGLVDFVKKQRIKGTEASYVKNIFKDIVSLKLITETDKIGNQKKSLIEIFPERRDIVELMIHKIEELQSVIANKIIQKDVNLLSEIDKSFVFNGKSSWPTPESFKRKREEIELAASIAEQESKNPRGRPKKYKF